MTSDEKERSSAQIIQRAFRHHRFKSQMHFSEPISDQLKKSMQQHFVSLNPQPPKHNHKISIDEKINWANSVKPELRDLAKKVALNFITYRSHSKFMKQLLHVIRQYNFYLHSLPETERDFALVVPDVGICRFPAIKSNHWVTALALPHLVKKPMAILFTYEVKQFKLDNPSLKHIVFFDDALYSGRQLWESIKQSQVAGVNTVLIVPFYTKRVSSIQRNHVLCFLGECMLLPEDITDNFKSWTDEDKQHFDALIPFEWNCASSKVGTFFNHKVADNVSTFLNDLYVFRETKSLIPSELKYGRHTDYG